MKRNEMKMKCMLCSIKKWWCSTNTSHLISEFDIIYLFINLFYLFLMKNVKHEKYQGFFLFPASPPTNGPWTICSNFGGNGVG